MQFPILYCTKPPNKRGVSIVWVWKLRVEGNKMYKESGHIDGKLKNLEPTVCEGTKTKKAEDEVWDKARQHWIKQLDKGYAPDKEKDKKGHKLYTKILEVKEQRGNRNVGLFQCITKDFTYIEPTMKNNVKDIEVGNVYKPMLCAKYAEVGSRYVDFDEAEGVYVDAKLDGVRSIAFYNREKNRVTLQTRTGKFRNFMDHIRDELMKIFQRYPDVILDGELYTHNIKNRKERFQLITEITSITRKTPHPREGELEFWIFDIIDKNKNMKKREKMLTRLLNIDKLKYIKKAPRYTVHTEKEMNQLHRKLFDDDYEGVIIRPMDGMYEQDKRSYTCLKLKYFEDAEATIVDAEKAKGQHSGAVIWILEGTLDGKKIRFKCTPMENIKKRKIMWEKREKYFGKVVTYKYTDVTKDNIPKYANVIAYRDYE